jgi:nucleotide-binding universal stress UspA family protein
MEAAKGSVVVGIDGSAESRAALRWAGRYAARLGRPLCAVAVWQDQLQFGPAAIFPEPEFEAEANRWLDRSLAELPPELAPVEVTTRVGRGDPVRVLVDVARDAEVLVLGNHGRGALAGALLGSVTLGCAHHARCPVVLVPRERAASGQPS